MRDYSISPRDRWLALHPDKTPEDWGTLVKDGLRKKELVQLDGRVYLSEAEKKRRQNERQRLCRKRRKEHIDALERENAKLRELVRDMWNGMCGYAHDCRSCEHYELYEGRRLVGECQYHARMRELGVEL